MEKQLLKSIAKNNTLTNLYASFGIVCLLGLVSLPFMGLYLLTFLCVILAPVFFVLMNVSERALYSDLKEAKEQLCVSMFTNDKALLAKCLQVAKSL